MVASLGDFSKFLNLGVFDLFKKRLRGIYSYEC